MVNPASCVNHGFPFNVSKHYQVVSVGLFSNLFYSGFTLASPSTPPRKRQVRFSARHDIILLREVIAQNPFASKEPGLCFFQPPAILRETSIHYNRRDFNMAMPV